MKKTLRKLEDFAAQRVERNGQRQVKGGFRKAPLTEPVTRTPNWGEIDIRFTHDDDRTTTRNNNGNNGGGFVPDYHVRS